MSRTEWVEEWKEMKKFADWLMGHGISCARSNENVGYDNKIWEQRVGVILVHQAAEILMKAYLVKRGDEIEIGNGTIKFMEAFDKIALPVIDREKFKRFNKIRNEIYHHSFLIPWDKNTEIQNFLIEFKKFYDDGFGEHLDFNNSVTEEKFKEIHKKLG